MKYLLRLFDIYSYEDVILCIISVITFGSFYYLFNRFCPKMNDGLRLFITFVITVASDTLIMLVFLPC